MGTPSRVYELPFHWRAMTVAFTVGLLKTLCKEGFRTAAESDQSDETGVFPGKGSTLRGTSGSVPFTVTHF